MASPTEVESLFRYLTDISIDASIGEPDTKYLDSRSRALAIVAAAVCTDASTPTLKSLVACALGAGATDEEILGTLFAVASAAGESRLVAVTPRVSLALGYDIDEAFEHE